jgi:prepilin-type processing-associated H-X9-DG protein
MTGFPNLATTSLVDYPGNYHNRAAGFSFADGHAEIKKWLDGRTTPVDVATANDNCPNNPDVFWLQERCTRLK